MKWFFLLSITIYFEVFSQPTNILITNAEADNVIKGNYSPADYAASTVINAPDVIVPEINQRILPDSLESYLTRLVSFHNRNTGSDTISTTRGIGAARRWVHSKMREFSAQNENRLLVTYLQFNETICSQNQHRNVLAVLPGTDTSNHAVVIVEAHMDSRCESGCDITCRAHGADDNGSGAVLVMELARVLSRYTFPHTIIFADVIGEEQGLYGSNALAEYLENQNVNIIGVQNNDVSGGIECGALSSPPSCSPEGAKDSTHIRIFSSQVNFSKNKAYARYVQLQHQELLNPILDVPMTLNILDPVDRTGRGGDHQPFSDRGVAAVRFTESYEHGDGSSTGGNQHTVRDVIGEDFDNNGSIDYYYVNFPYLSRNAKINAVGLAMAALSPAVPTVDLSLNNQGQVQVEVLSNTQPEDIFLVGVRTSDNDFDFVFRFSGPGPFIIPALQSGTNYYVSVAAVNDEGVESMFSQEVRLNPNSDGPTGLRHYYFEKHTDLGVNIRKLKKGKATQINIEWKGKPLQKVQIKVLNIVGKELQQWNLMLKQGQNEVVYDPKSSAVGMHYFRLILDGKVVYTQKAI